MLNSFLEYLQVGNECLDRLIEELNKLIIEQE